MAELRYDAGTSAADWLVRSGTPFEQLITFGPAVFEAYARLRFIADPDRPGQQEADADVPYDHPSDLAQARRALHLLEPFTSTPGDCCFLLWEGYSDSPLPPPVAHGPLVELPHRRYALLRGPLAAVDVWQAHVGGGAPPAFVWPADRRWCFVSDVDPHWAGLGAARAAIGALLGDPQLDIVEARPGQEQPRYR